MKLKKLWLKELAQNWEIGPIVFSPSMTLLVGVSGAGKTRILSGVWDLTRLLQGALVGHLQWETQFEDAQGSVWEWQGEYGAVDETVGEPQTSQTQFAQESLSQDGRLIFLRTNGQVLFDDKAQPRLDPGRSLLQTLSGETLITPLFQTINRIRWVEQQPYPVSPTQNFKIVNREHFWRHKWTLPEIKTSSENALAKLFLCNRHAPEQFRIIQQQFQEVFPFVIELGFEPVPEQTVMDSVPQLLFHEQGITQTLVQSSMATGMFRSLWQLAELALCHEGSILLIDEFENSLGINCMDAIMDAILTTRQDIQYLITSHHPYIINAVPMQDWQIVSRQKSKVTAHPASDFALGKSRHEAFLQLINLPEFVDGISA